MFTKDQYFQFIKLVSFVDTIFVSRVVLRVVSKATKTSIMREPQQIEIVNTGNQKKPAKVKWSKSKFTLF